MSAAPTARAPVGYWCPTCGDWVSPLVISERKARFGDPSQYYHRIDRTTVHPVTRRTWWDLRKEAAE